MKKRTKKPRIWLTRTIHGFAPSTALDDETIALAYPLGAEVEAEFFHHRSKERMRLYWAVMTHVYHNQERGYASKEKISDALLVAAGICSPERRLDGTIVMVPDSIAFENMDEAAFKSAFDRVLDLIHNHFGLDIKSLLAEGHRLITKKTYPYQGVHHANKETIQDAA